MKNRPALRDAGDRLAIGTIESWLVWKLTGGVHITDATNAGRTALAGLTGGWDAELADLFGVPLAALPEIVDCAGSFGTTSAFGPPIPICGLAGDQQAASIGQACFSPGDTKATFGTGAFILTHAGNDPPRSDHRLLTTVASQIAGRRQYALEGSIFVAGSLIRWMRDSLALIDTADETEALARSVPDNGGVYVVPALSGLGAPWWEPDARAAIAGLGFSTGKAQIVRAALEAMAHQAQDLKAAFAADGQDWTTLRIDGGMAANDWIAQDLADILELTVERPRFVETTALGAAMLAGIGCGWFADLFAAAEMRGVMATDIDPRAIDVTQENAAANDIADIALVVADGALNAAIESRAPYDLVIANILAGPLVSMAAEVAAIAAPGATIVLAGLLETQRGDVVAAFTACGCSLDAVDQRGDWTILRLTAGAQRFVPTAPLDPKGRDGWALDI